MDTDLQILEEINDWVKVAEDHLRRDRGDKPNPVRLPDTKQDKINRAACERAAILCAMAMMQELGGDT